MKKWMFALVALFTLLALMGCKDPEPDKTWVISYDANGWEGTGVPASTGSVVRGKAIGAANLPALNDTDTQEFKGWATASNGEVIGAAFIPSADTTLYVRWESKVPPGEPVSITYNANGWEGTGVPAAGEAISGQPIGAAAIPVLTDTANQKFMGWALTATGEVIDEWYVSYTNFNLFVIWLEIIAPGQPIEINFIANGFEGDMPADTTGVSGDPIGALPVLPNNPVQEFLGWSVSSNGALIQATDTFNTFLSLFAIWKSVVPVGFEEIAALSNGAAVIYKFSLPPGGTLGDYVSIQFDVLLNNPEDSGVVNLRPVRLYGPYSDKDFTTDESTAAWAQHDGTQARMARFLASQNAQLESKLQGWIAGQKYNDWTTDFGVAYGLVDPALFDANSYNTIEFTLNGQDGLSGPNTPVGAGNWPAPNARGPFYFGIGISGGAGGPNSSGVVVQTIKNVRLMPAAAGIDPVYSVSSGFDIPAFAAYLDNGALNIDGNPTNVMDAWRGSSIDDAPLYVRFYGNGQGAEPAEAMRYAFKGNTLASVPVIARLGFLFDGWTEDAEGNIPATISTSTAINANAAYYAQWDIDPAFIPDPDWEDLTVKWEIGSFTWLNGTLDPFTGQADRQRGWPTYGAGGVEYTLALEDMQNAVYLVMEVETVGQAGGNIRLRRASEGPIGFPGAGTDIFNNGASTHDSTIFIEPEEGEEGTSLIIINMKQALGANHALLMAETNWAMIAMQYWGSDPAHTGGWSQFGEINAWFLFKDDYVVKSPIEGWQCTCPDCITEHGAGNCDCTLGECGNECWDCGHCAEGRKWRCPCTKCAEFLYAQRPNVCGCTQATCATACTATCICYVPATYVKPADTATVVYINLNDYRQDSPAGVAWDPAVPAGTLAADKITLNFAGGERQRVNFRLTSEQAAKVLASSGITIEIKGSATPDVNFRYSFADAKAGGDWQSTDIISGNFNSILSLRDLPFHATQKDLRRLGYFSLQKMVGGATEVVIEEIKITIEGLTPERIVAPIAGTLMGHEGSAAWAGDGATAQFFTASDGKTYLLTGDARSHTGTLNADFADSQAVMDAYNGMYSRYFMEIPEDIFGNLASHGTITLTYDAILVSGNPATAPQVGFKNQNGAAGGGWTSAPALEFGTGKSIVIQSSSYITGYAESGNAGVPSMRHLGIVPQNANHVFLIRFTSITFGDMAAYVEPAYLADAAISYSIADGTSNKVTVGGLVYEFVHNQASLNGVAIANATPAEANGITPTSNHVRYKYEAPAGANAYAKITMFYDVITVVIGETNGGSNMLIRKGTDTNINTGQIFGGGLGIGRNRVLTLPAEGSGLAGTDTHLWMTPGSGHYLFRVSKVVFHN